MAHHPTVEGTPQLYSSTTRFRRFALLIIVFFLAGSWGDLAWWRVVALVLVWFVLFGSELAERFVVFTIPWSKRWLLAFLIAYLCQVTFVLITGGIHSPFLVIFVPIATLAAIAVGWSAYVPLVSAQILSIWAMAVPETLGWIPAAFYPEQLHYTHNPPVAVLIATIFTAILIGLGVLGLQITALLRARNAEALVAQRETAEALQDRNRDLIAMTEAVAHELKNPLTAVQSLATLLQRRAQDGTREAEMLDVLVGELHRVRDTLQEFRDFSRPIEPLQLRRVDLSALVERVARGQQALARERDVQVEVSGDGSPDPVVLPGDPRKLQQVLVNLLQNAIEASHDGGRVALTCQATEDGAEIAIRDRGAGLAPEIRERLFSPGATTKPTGTGLGLAISRGIAEQHGGALNLRDASGGGCIATLSLPSTALPSAIDAQEPT